MFKLRLNKLLSISILLSWAEFRVIAEAGKPACMSRGRRHLDDLGLQVWHLGFGACGLGFRVSCFGAGFREV